MEGIVTISQKEYQDLLNKIALLEKQNHILKDKQQTNQDIFHHSLHHDQTTIFKNICTIKPEQLKQSWVEWSKKIGNAIKPQRNSNLRNSRVEIFLEDDQDEQIHWPSAHQQQQSQVQLIEDICLFGPNQQQIINSQHRAFSVGCQLYYPQQNRYQAYGSYLFPQDIQVKEIKQQKHQSQANRVIFKKNAKRQDNSVYIFQGEQNHPIFSKINQENQLLYHANPASKLYAFCLHFTDFLTIKQQQTNLSQLTFSERNIQTPLMFEKKISLVENSSKLIAEKTNNNKWKLFTSKYCVCLFTYFPFVSLYERILVKIIDQIKIKRMQIYNNQPQNLSSIDFKYFKYEMRLIASKIISEINSISPILGSVGQFHLGQQQHQINLSVNNLKMLMYDGWVNQCLKNFNKDTFYQVLSSMLLEQSMCFIGQDINSLTHTVLLFNDLLLRPFSSPHPCISLMFKQQLLGTPFILTIGVNKNTKWLQQNIDLFSENKVIINMNEQIQIKSKKKSKIQKSEKLKKIIQDYYKKNQTSSIPLFFKRKQSLVKSNLQQDNDVITFINNLKQFFQEEILNHLPTKEVIFQLKRNIDITKLNECKLMTQMIEKHFLQSRKKEKDGFIDQLAQQQLFYVLICQRYGLK